MIETTPCPTRDDLVRLARDELPKEQFDSVGDHVATCSRCEEVFAQIEDSPDRLAKSLRRITLDDLESARAEIESDSGNDTATSVWNHFASVEPKANQRTLLTTPCQLGQYQILRMIGRGGMGEVYEARHMQLEVPRAVKVIRGSRQDDPVSYGYFLEEMKTIGPLEHPNLVRAFDAWEKDGCLFLVLELLDGDSLQTLIKQGQIRSVAEIIDTMLGTCRGLEQLHTSNLIHQDVKPANIMRLKNGSIKLIDFGLAIGKNSGQSVGHGGAGTRGYMSPEQASGSDTVGHRSDIYSAGRVLKSLIQELPDAADSDLADGVSELETLAEWMTQRDVKSRPQNMYAVVVRLENLQRSSQPPSTSLHDINASPAAKAPGKGHVAKGRRHVSTTQSPQKTTPTVAAQPEPRTRRRGIGWLVSAAVLIGLFGLGAYQILFQTRQITTVVVENHQSGDVIQVRSQDGKVRSIELGEQPKIVVDPGHYTLSLKEPGNRRLSPADIQVTGRDRLTVRIEDIPGEAGGVPPNQPDATSPDAKTPLAQATLAEPASPTQLAGPTIRNTVGMQLRLIPAGAFTMGSPMSEKYRNPGEDQHRVILTKSFYLGVTEVTQRQWQTVMETTPWKGKDLVQEGDNYPASYISWDDAVEFCRKLSAREGVQYRLPTESEWEYACRAGSAMAYTFGDDDSELGAYGWFLENAREIGIKHAQPAGGKKPNQFGLHDMHGNVWEWCQDRFGLYPSGDVTDPTGSESGPDRVCRGGSWYSTSDGCRSAYRLRKEPDFRIDRLGFRVVRNSVK